MDRYEAHLKKRAWLIKSESNEFLSNPQFVLDHLSNLDELRDCLVFYVPECGDTNTICYSALNGLIKIGQLNIPPKFNEMVPQYVGDVDGLVCLLFNDVYAAVFNPILQKWNIPPELPFDDVTPSCYGFGKDVDGDYKVLRLRESIESKKKQRREVAVFSCSSNTWSVKRQMFPNNLRTSCHGHCVAGVIYFLCSIEDQVPNWEDEKCVISAINLSDISSNTQLELPMNCSDERACNLFLFRLHDHLGLIQLFNEPGCSRNRTCCSKRIWSMQKPGDWTVMFTVSGFAFPKRYLPWRNELVMVESQLDGSFLIYLVGANSECKLERKLKVDPDDFVYDVDTCLASLVSPCSV